MTPDLKQQTYSAERKVPDTSRPFRIWDSIRKRDVKYRYYSTEQNALNGALLLIKWVSIQNTLEVYDIRTARWIATYQRKLHSITFTR